MTFAFLILGDFDPERDRAVIGGGAVTTVGVPCVEAACAVAVELQTQGVGCIELCGGFTEAGARRILEATGGQVAVGYAVHLPEQDELYRKLFG